jgi:CPA2 family monovalent cation:H+ antiporter-2
MESSFRGLHDVFSSVFFVSIGMMIDPRLLGGAWPLVLGVTAFALVIRPLACSLALVAIGTSPREARKAGLLLTPLGEFSFIIAQLGVTTAVLPPSFYPVAVGASLLTILATPTVNRHRERVLRTWERLEPRFVTRALEAYHAWFDQLRNRPARTVLWKLVRPRLAQTAAELLFVSGLLIFAEPLFGFVAEAPFFRHMEPATFAYGFWSVVAFIVLLPLVAIWRNCAALAMLLGEGWAHARLPSRVIERALQAAVAFGLASWLYLVLPRTPFADLGWLVIAVGAAGVVALFSRHLVRWHSHWLASVREVLADRPEDRDEASLPVSSDHA